MGLLPELIGDIEIRQRKKRYAGEPNYKTLSFVRRKEPKNDVSWEVAPPIFLPPLSFQQDGQFFWQHPEWHHLPQASQRFYLAEYERTGIQPRFEHRINHHLPPPPPYQPQLHFHHGALPPPPPLVPLSGHGGGGGGFQHQHHQPQPQHQHHHHHQPMTVLQPQVKVIEPKHHAKKNKRGKSGKGYSIFEDATSDTDSNSTYSSSNTFRSSTSSGSSGSGSSFKPLRGWR